MDKIIDKIDITNIINILFKKFSIKNNNINNNINNNNKLKYINIIIKNYKSKNFLKNIKLCHDIYIKYGARSSKKVDYLHNFIKTELETILISEIYSIKLEQNIDSYNASNTKKCDIVIYKYNNPYIIFPVKYIMSNYNQNKNNSWESLTGEILHLKKKNHNIHIIPINIIINKIPYLNAKGIIQKFEKINYIDTFEIYNNLINWNLCSDTINYIIDVEQQCNINEEYNKSPKFINFNKDTPFRTFNTIISPLL